MAKFFGKIGYAELVETEPGIWDERITERQYSGDLNQNIRNLQSSNKVNDDIDIANEISIIADQFAYQNFHMMRYVWFMGARWKIRRVTVNHPRLVLTVGGVYNGEQA